MNKTIIYSIAVIILVFTSGSLFAQVTFRMKRAPLNQLRAADLWNATIINTGETFTAYLYGSMTNNENSELIATGQTMTFVVKKGTTNFKISDLPKIPDVSYLAKDPKYKQSFMNTGGAPPGDYKICCELRYTNNSVAGEDCFDQKITGGDAPQLISPRDEEELRIDNPVFTWMHTKAPGSNQTYTLRIVELKESQSPDEAIKRNKAFFEKEGISPTLFQYPASAPKFETGKKYVWLVKIGDLQSTMSIFDRWGNFLIAQEITCKDFKFNIVQNNKGDEKRKISPGTREGDTALNKGDEKRKISPGTREGDTALNKGNEKMKISIDIKDYDISITNNYSGLPANRPVSFTITANTKIISASDVPDGWKRTPSKFPPGSSGIKWTNNSGDIPIGLTDLGSITFENSSSEPIVVIYEWLNKDGRVICKDTVQVVWPVLVK